MSRVLLVLRAILLLVLLVALALPLAAAAGPPEFAVDAARVVGHAPIAVRQSSDAIVVQVPRGSVANLDGKRLRGCTRRRCSIHLRARDVAAGAHRLVITTPPRRRSVVRFTARWIRPTVRTTAQTGGATLPADSARVTWTTTGRVRRTSCRVDGGTFEPCSTPYVAAGLRAGHHTIAVRVANDAGTSTATAKVLIDARPEVAFQVTPPSSGDARDVTFSWTTAGPVDTLVCRLDSAAYAPCASPATYRALDAGQHTFDVRASRGSFAAVATDRFTVVGPPASAGVLVTLPTDGASPKGVVRLQATVAGSPTWMDFTIDDVVVASDNASPYAVSWDTASVPAGAHLLRVVARDARGGGTISPAITIHTDGIGRYDVEASRFATVAAAVAALRGRAGSVHVPAGRFAVKDLRLAAGQVLIGSGQGRTVLEVAPGAATTSAIRIGGSGVLVSDLSIDGNRSSGATGSGWAVQLAPGSNDVVIRRVTVTDVVSYAIYLWGSHERDLIEDSTLDGGSAASAGVNDLIGDDTSGHTAVLRTTIQHFLDYGIHFFPYVDGIRHPGAGALAAGDTILDIKNPGTANGTNEGGIWTGGIDAVISGNSISDTGWDGIETFGMSDRPHVVGNIIARTKSGIYIEHETYDGTFEDNVISDVTADGINVEWWYGGHGSKRQTIRRNTIISAPVGLFIDVGADANLIEDNLIYDTGGHGITLQGSSGNIVRNNVVRDRRAAPVEDYGIAEQNGRWEDGSLASPARNTITGNDCRGARRGAVQLFGAGSIATGNIWP